MEATFSKRKYSKSKNEKSRKSHTWWDPCNHSLNFTCVNYFGAFHLMVSASFKTNNEVFTIPIQWIPKSWHPENYSVIWERIPLLTFFKNTLFLSIVITIIQLFTSSFAAYGFSK